MSRLVVLRLLRMEVMDTLEGVVVDLTNEEEEANSKIVGVEVAALLADEAVPVNPLQHRFALTIPNLIAHSIYHRNF
jgi:hypothetical protein